MISFLISSNLGKDHWIVAEEDVMIRALTITGTRGKLESVYRIIEVIAIGILNPHIDRTYFDLFLYIVLESYSLYLSHHSDTVLLVQ